MPVGGQRDTEYVFVISTEHHDQEAEAQKHQPGAAGGKAGWAPHVAYLLKFRLSFPCCTFFMTDHSWSV